MFNSIFNTKITFLINGESYVYNGAPDVAFTITDDRSIEGARGTANPNDGVTFVTNAGAPYSMTGSIVNVSLAVQKLLEKTFDENFKNNLDYRFKIVLEGVNSLGEHLKAQFDNCFFSKRPLQTEISQNLSVLTLEIKAFEQKETVSK